MHLSFDSSYPCPPSIRPLLERPLPFLFLCSIEGCPLIHITSCNFFVDTGNTAQAISCKQTLTGTPSSYPWSIHLASMVRTSHFPPEPLRIRSSSAALWSHEWRSDSQPPLQCLTVFGWTNTRLAVLVTASTLSSSWRGWSLARTGT